MRQFHDNTRRLFDYFEGGRLPSMAYINRQSRDRSSIQRPLHKHKSVCELLLVYEGNGVYHVENHTYFLKTGSLILSNQGELHAIETETDQEIGIYCIGISNLHRKGLPENHLVPFGGPYVLDTQNYFIPILRMMETIYQLETLDSTGNLSVQLLMASCVLLCTRLNTHVSTSLPGRHVEPISDKVKKYIDEHLTESIQISDLATVAGCSEGHVSHVFKKATGTTPAQYIIHRRIGKAQSYLISTDYPVTQIATLVGYDNANYFSTQFSKLVGMSPSEYRIFYQQETHGNPNQT